MSYDLIIRSDDRYSQVANHASLASFIRGLPQTRGTLHYEDRALGVFLSISLETPIGDGETADPSHLPGYNPAISTIDRVNLAIPYAFYPATVDHAYDLITGIAEFLDWRIYDPQRDAYW